MKPRCDASSSTAGEARWRAKAPGVEVRLSSLLKFMRSAGGRGESTLYCLSQQQSNRVGCENCFLTKSVRRCEPHLMPRREEDRVLKGGSFVVLCLKRKGLKRRPPKVRAGGLPGRFCV